MGQAWGFLFSSRPPNKVPSSSGPSFSHGSVPVLVPVLHLTESQSFIM